MALSRSLLPVLVLVAGLAACDGNKASKEPSDSGATPTAAGNKDNAAKAKGGGAGIAGVANAAKDGAEPAGGEKVKVVDADGTDDRYAVEVVSPSDAKAGQAGTAVVKIVPKEPWHINLDFPTSLKLTAPETLAVANANLKKADLAKLEDTGCEYNVDFTPSAAGDHTVSGTFKFAVCKDEACVPVSEKVEFKVAVK